MEEKGPEARGSYLPPVPDIANHNPFGGPSWFDRNTHERQKILLSYSILGIPMRIQTLDLARQWQAIHDDLMKLPINSISPDIPSPSGLMRWSAAEYDKRLGSFT